MQPGQYANQSISESFGSFAKNYLLNGVASIVLWLNKNSQATLFKEICLSATHKHMQSLIE